jgi:molecular chaperone HtpG
MTTDTKPATHQFKAETKQLLNILIHSLYTEKDIFLRELISNASDALSRYNFVTLTTKEFIDPEVPLEITIKTDKENNTLTISDTGIGMNQSEMVENLGTIAHSGAKAFLEAAENAKEMDLATIIGQFGVGFYSAFMIAEKIVVISRSYRPEDLPAKWESDGGDQYSITQSEKNNRGTDVILYLKEDAKEYLEDYRLRQIVKHHSDYIAYPIFLNDSKEQLNRQTALWRQQPQQVKAEEYTEFYKQFTFDFNDPLTHLHLSIDAPVQFFALLFIPASPEPNIFSDRKDYGLKLYARKVLIQEFTRDLLPEFMRFVQGVVDSEDIPINVSREAVQSTKTISQIKTIVTSKIFDHLNSLANKDPEKYENFWKEYGIFLKEGMAVSPEHFDQIIPLLRFNTLEKEGAFLSFKNYVENFKPKQNKIYYIIGEDKAALKNSPHLEVFKKRNINVLLFSDPVDPFMLINMNKFEDYELINVTAADVGLPPAAEEEQKEAEETKPAENINEILAFFKTTLGEKIKEVRLTEQLVESPARLVDSEGSPSPELQKAYRYLQKDMEAPQKVLEINPHHPVIRQLGKISGVSALRSMIIEQIYENALINEGVQPDISAMLKRINSIILAALPHE